MRTILHVLIATGVSCTLARANDKPNILFIAVDDLRPELGCYGTEHIITPNIDRLASAGSTFLNSYCNVPVCGASRASILSGIRPITGKRFMSYLSRADTEAEGIVTLPHHFKNNGYTTISNGKIFHHREDSLEAWSVDPWHDINYSKNWASSNFDTFWKLPESKKKLTKRGRGPYYESADVPDNEYQDGKVADKTIIDLKRLKDSGKPFFMACGFWKPHLPLTAPKKYFDMYNKDTLPLAPNPQIIKNLPKECKNSGEIYSYSQVKEDKKSGKFEQNIRHAYFACVSYVDAQIGRVLDELDNLELSDNTIVVLWGDHGWHLGEHSFFGKHNALNNATRSPLIIKAPGMTQGAKLSQLSEFVDVYPTLCDLAKIVTPKHCQGLSLKPVLRDITAETKDAVFIEWKNSHTIKTKQFAYTEFIDKKGITRNSMLFNHAKDPDENVNIANNPEYSHVIEQLATRLHEHNNQVR